MEILGLSLAVLGLLFTYIWRANGRLQKSMMQSLERIGEGQREIAQGQKEIVQGQKEIAQMVERGLSTLAQMLLNQTKILERIEAKSTPSS